MCQQRCKHLWDACDECIQELFDSHENHLEHKAALAIVPASDDEWRRRLDEECPLVTLPNLTSLQGLSE